MLRARQQLFDNADMQFARFGEGPFTVTGATLDRWRLVRTGSPSVQIRRRGFDDSIATPKWYRDGVGVKKVMQLDMLAALSAGQQVSVQQQVEHGYRYVAGPMNLLMTVFGPKGATIDIGVAGAYRQVRTKGIGKGVNYTGAIAAGGTDNIQLASSAPAYDDALNGQWIEITGEDGVGQIEQIADYTGATRECALVMPLRTAITTDSTYRVAKVPLPTPVNRRFTVSDIGTEYLTGEIFRNPSQAGTWFIVIATLSPVHNLPHPIPYELVPLADEERNLWRFIYPVGNGVRGGMDGTEFRAPVKFPVAMRTTPSFVLRQDDDLTIRETDTGTTHVAATPSVTLVNATAEGATLVIDGFGALPTGPAALDDDLVGLFTADYSS